MPSWLSHVWADAGFTALELLLTTAIAMAIAVMTLPLTGNALDEVRAGMAARYVESRILDARLQAIRRSRCVALRFAAAADGSRFAEYVDGNSNGVRAADISAGVDALLTPPERLGDQFTGVSFGLRGTVPDVDGSRSGSDGDGIRIGTSRILTLGPDGTATSGTLYIRGRKAQFAVRVLGATGRTRLLRYDRGSGQWVPR